MSGAPVAGPQALRTARLALRPIVPSDREALHALLTHPEVRRYLMDDEVVPIGDVDDIIATSARHFADGVPGHFAMRLRKEGAAAPLVGTSGLTRFADGVTPELLYALHPDFRGRGLAVEGTRAVLEHFFATSGVPEVFARADVPNRDSIRVMELLGMRFLREEVEKGLPLVTYEMTRAMFDAEASRASSSDLSQHSPGSTLSREG